jgi:sugar lactone lactonase YvrE
MATSSAPRLLLTVLAVLLLASGTVLRGALPTFWRVATEADFLKGEVENLSVDAFGRLELGPSTQSVYETSAPFLWTTAAADGSIFIGSGNEGQVYRVDRAGRGTVFFDAEELEVHAIVPAPGGGLFVGTSPDGKVYKVDASGTGAVFFDPQDRYIWSLALDRGGNLFVATGDKGVIYKVAPDGTSSKFYETKATHAMALAFDREGRLLAGTESPGRVFRIDANGRPFVVLDSSYSEVRALRLDAAGNAYALAVSGRPASGGGPPAPAAGEATSTPVASVSTEISAVVVVSDAGGGAGASSADAGTARSNQGPASGAVFRITPDGVADVVWESREDTPYDVAMEPDGDVLVATGNKGKIYRLSGDPLRPTLVARANAQQVTALLREPDGQTLFATSNPGRLMRLSSGSATRGTYTSDVRDAQTVATWGTLRWQARTPQGARVEIATRSGNTRTPDETWSDWTAAYADPEGTAITSPRARYLQWRAVLTGARSGSPMLTSVTAAYLPRNTRPRVTGLTIYPPGTVFQRPFPTDPEIAGFGGETLDRRNLQTQPPAPGGAPPLGRRAYQKGLLTFVWRAEDDNRDELVYDVSYRREGDDAWKPLKRGENDTILVWDTTSVPNGRYLLRVVASDSPSNSPATALSGAFESQTFDIDNAPPVLAVTSVRRDGPRTVIAFDALDEHSAIQRAEYSLDGERWVPLYPRDGIADSRIEQYELSVEGDFATRVLLRAADALNNVVSARGDAPSGGR